MKLNDTFLKTMLDNSNVINVFIGEDKVAVAHNTREFIDIVNKYKCKRVLKLYYTYSGVCRLLTVDLI